MTATAIAPDERAFRAHVDAGPFVVGVDRGRWELVDISWPFALINVAAADRVGAPSAYLFRFDLMGYPNVAATACLWHADEQRPLVEAERPKVTWSPSPFRYDWENGRALYLPCDRVAIQGHANWATEHPGELWDAREGVTKYLLILSALLSEDGYVGL